MFFTERRLVPTAVISQFHGLADLQVGLVFAALVTTLAGLLVAGHVLGRRTRGAATAPQAPAVDAVRCPECETENERGYRYCRRWLSELPLSMRFADGGSSPFRTHP